MQRKFEVRIHTVESHINSFMSALKSIHGITDDELGGLGCIVDNSLLSGQNSGLAGLHSQVVEAKSIGFFEEVINDVQSLNKKHIANLEEKTRQQYLEIQDALELATVSATPTAPQLKDSMSAMKVQNERLQHEMNECIQRQSRRSGRLVL